MDGSKTLGKVAARWIAGTVLAGATGAVCAADPMTTTDDLLRDATFKAAYVGALGPRAKEKWLARMSNSALVRTVALGGRQYQVATPCKPHDCAENNLLLLYAPATGVVYGRLYEKGRFTSLGNPDAAMNAELEKMWKKEFRQQ